MQKNDNNTLPRKPPSVDQCTRVLPLMINIADEKCRLGPRTNMHYDALFYKRVNSVEQTFLHDKNIKGQKKGQVCIDASNAVIQLASDCRMLQENLFLNKTENNNGTFGKF